MSNSNTSETEKVGAFFESYAGSFDSIYGHEAKRTVMEKITDKLFRQTMFVRFKETLKHTANPKIKSIIDIGCGPGHYCAAFLHESIGVPLSLNLCTCTHCLYKKHYNKL